MSVKDEFFYLRCRIEQDSSVKNLPGKFSSLGDFLSECFFAIKFLLAEKENFVFAFLQFVVVGFVYFLWLQFLGWIPEGVWSQISDDNYNHMIDVLFLLWSFLCVGIATYPIGILTACMSASFTLRSQNKPSTVWECLKVVLPQSWTLWVFSWIDGWLTVLRILDRLPKKNNKTPPAVRAAKEMFYQLWKIATLGVIPSLV